MFNIKWWNIWRYMVMFKLYIVNIPYSYALKMKSKRGIVNKSIGERKENSKSYATQEKTEY